MKLANIPEILSVALPRRSVTKLRYLEVAAAEWEAAWNEMQKSRADLGVPSERWLRAKVAYDWANSLPSDGSCFQR